MRTALRFQSLGVEHDRQKFSTGAAARRIFHHQYVLYQLPGPSLELERAPSLFFQPMRVCFVIDMCFAQHHTPENAHFNSVQQWGEKVFIRFRACTRTQRQTPLLWRSAQVSPAKQVIRDGVASAAACYTRLRIPHRLSSCQPSASDRTAGAAWMRFRRPRARCCERSHVPFAPHPSPHLYSRPRIVRV